MHLHFSCHFSPSSQEKAEFLEQILVCGGSARCVHAVSNCHCVQSRASRGRRGSDALGERLGRGGEEMCHNQVQKPHLRWRPASSSRGRIPLPAAGFLQVALKWRLEWKGHTAGWNGHFQKGGKTKTTENPLSFVEHEAVRLCFVCSEWGVCVCVCSGGMGGYSIFARRTKEVISWPLGGSAAALGQCCTCYCSWFAGIH